MNSIVLQAMREELTKIAYMTAAGPIYTGNMPKSMGSGMVSARQAQQMTQMPGMRSMRRGGVVPKGKTQLAVLHGPEAVVPLGKDGKPSKQGKRVLERAQKEKAADVRSVLRVARKKPKAKFIEVDAWSPDYDPKILRDAFDKKLDVGGLPVMDLRTQLAFKESLKRGGKKGAQDKVDIAQIRKFLSKKDRTLRPDVKSAKELRNAVQRFFRQQGLPSDTRYVTISGSAQSASGLRRKPLADADIWLADPLPGGRRNISTLVKRAAEDHLEKTSEVEYRGTTFPGYNKPIRSNRKNKKKMVLVKRGDKVKLVHFGQKGYEDFTQHKDKKRRKNYLTRSAGIRNKAGKLTKDDPFSPNYWARRELW